MRTDKAHQMRHGGDLEQAREQYGGELADWLDLSTGINPHAWPYADFQVPNGAFTRLPGAAEMQRTLNAARQAYRIPSWMEVVAAPGTEMLLQWLARMTPQGPAVIVAPTYSGHALAWRQAGRDLTEVADLSVAATLPWQTLVLVNPNNPDGRIVAPADLLALARERPHAMILVDEAYADVAPQASILPYLTNERVGVLRSFGKFFGLAGLRLGFLAAPPVLAGAMRAALGDWPVSGPALALGRVALEDSSWQTDMRERLAREAASLDRLLAGRGLNVLGGTALFRLIRTANAPALHTLLAQQHIWTRLFDYSEEWLRIGLPPSAADFTRLDEALTQSIAKLSGSASPSAC